MITQLGSEQQIGKEGTRDLLQIYHSWGRAEGKLPTVRYSVLSYMVQVRFLVDGHHQHMISIRHLWASRVVIPMAYIC